MPGADRYRVLLPPLGQNDCLTVYRGYDNKPPRRHVAIMELAERFRANPERFDQIWDEVLSFAQLSHHRLVPVFDWVQEKAWIITELLPGNLADDAAQGALTNERVREALRAGLEALDYLHGQGKLHGDVRPRNLLVDAKRNVRLSHPLGLEIGGQVYAKRKNAKYLAPELVSEDFGNYGPATDLYCLGFAAYELLVGPEFDRRLGITPDVEGEVGASKYDWPRFHGSAAAIKPINQLVPQAAPDLVEVIGRMTAKRVNDRAQTAHELLELLAPSDEPGPEPAEIRPKLEERVVPYTTSSQPPRNSSTTAKSTRTGKPAPAPWLKLVQDRRIAIPLAMLVAVPIGLLLKAAMNPKSIDPVPPPKPPADPAWVTDLLDSSQSLKETVDSLADSVIDSSARQVERASKMEELLTTALDRPATPPNDDLANKLDAMRASIDVLGSRIAANPGSAPTEVEPAEDLTADALAGRAQRRLQARDFAGALADVEAALRREPDAAEAFSKLAFEICLAQGQQALGANHFEAAAAAFSKALAYARQSEQQALALGNRGTSHLQEGKFPSAIDDFEAAIAKDAATQARWSAELSRAYATRGERHFAAQDYAIAADDFARAVQLDPKSADTLARLAACEARLQQPDRAIEHFLQAFAISPATRQQWVAEASQLLLARAQQHVAANQTDLARSDIDAALALQPGSAAAFTARGALAVRLEQYDQALGDFTRARELSAELPAAWFDGARLAYAGRGRQRAASGQHRLAVGDFTAALRFADQDGQAYLARAQSYASLGNLPEAIEDFDRTIELGEPDDPAIADRQLATALLGRANACHRLRQYEASVRDFSALIASGTDDPEIYVKRGMGLENLGRHQEAIADFDEAIALDDRWSVAYNNRGVSYLALEKFSDAQRDFTAAIELDNAYADAYHNRHIVMYRLGRPDEAGADLRQANQLRDAAAVR